MSAKNQFSQTLVMSLLADYFLINRMTNRVKIEEGFFLASNMYQGLNFLLTQANIQHHYEELESVFGPKNRGGFIKSVTGTSSDNERFLDLLDDLFMSVNQKLRPHFEIPMPSIYDNGKDINLDRCNGYLKDIEIFFKNFPFSSVSIPLGRKDDKEQLFEISVPLSGA
jgi:hypothetical protein